MLIKHVLHIFCIYKDYESYEYFCQPSIRLFKHRDSELLYS